MRELTYIEAAHIAGGINNFNTGLGFIDTNFLQQAYSKAKKDGYILGGIGGALTGAAIYGITNASSSDVAVSVGAGLVAAIAAAPYFYLIGFSTSKVWTNPLA